MKRLLVVLFAVFAVAGLAPFAQAKAPMVGKQVPGFYRMQLGAFEITALHDGPSAIDAKLLRNIEPAAIQQLAERMFVDYPVMPNTVNAYLINTGEHLVLVDAGASTSFAPNLGNLLANLKAAGYSPDQVDAVLLTHLHPDHVGALTDDAGKAVFSQAQVFTNQKENDYWLAKDAQDKAPAAMQSMFQTAQHAAAPYVAAKQWHTFKADAGLDAALVPGIKPVALHGHTPGHSGFLVESEGKSLLIWGDVVHVHAVQFARPGAAIAFDVDQNMAMETRRKVMQQAAEERMLVAGMHLPFPGIGHLRKDGDDRYSWVPVEFQPYPEGK
ncbi:MAG: MBL fold metallo-hydrolase [Desulfobulbus sp.]|jgi:glyoxylase-like metal-dependent hydrolase (beta-lactamase superfamily II)